MHSAATYDCKEDYTMDQIKKEYTDELKNRIDAWEGAVIEDFQEEPLRSELRNSMKDWLAEKMPDMADAELSAANRKIFILCIADIIYNEKVRPNLDEFILNR